MMTNFPTILSRLTGMFPEERIDYIDSIGRYDLLILDDLGVERNTSYAMEQMFQVVDRRYRSCKPLIVTTNLSLEQMKTLPMSSIRVFMVVFWNTVRPSSFRQRYEEKQCGYNQNYCQRFYPLKPHFNF